jgi:dinuclear metal center YbgI/SA1388 family protein
MTALHELVRWCDQALDVASFDDYCPNGLQVEAGRQVQNLVSGVTASQALIDAAAAAGADTLLVHHGYFWKGEPQPLTGMKGQRVASLFRHGINLIAYHLPLDAHPEWGNNRQLGEQLGLAGAPVATGSLVWRAPWDDSVDALQRRLATSLGRAPLHLPGGPQHIRHVAWCTGAAQGYITQAAAGGCDAFISGEVSEHTAHEAAELGLHYFGAGHHATERYGVQALGTALAARFGISHRFIDIPNPV